MNSQDPRLEHYNRNTYIEILRFLYEQLFPVESFLASIVQPEHFRNIDHLTEKYQNIFTDTKLFGCIDFKIQRIHNSLHLRFPSTYDKGNSYYHLKLKLNSPEIIWLDNLYGGSLSKIVKFYKHLFAKIDNYFVSLNPEQIKIYGNLLSQIKEETLKFLQFAEQRDVISKKKKLEEHQLSKIPFGGLFYITHLKNIQSILKLGILSHNSAHSKGVVAIDISNQQVNNRRNRIDPTIGNIHDFAPLYINPKNPMLFFLCKNGYRDNLILFKVNLHILLTENVAFSDGNAAVRSTSFYTNIDDFNKLNWTVIKDEYWTNHIDGKRIKCSEVLVKELIPLYYINEIHICNEKLIEDIMPLFPNHLGIKIIVSPQLFF
ncbi:MAG: DUF4433 domain-containing protein [Cyclobacteriaceae bacterium]|nr:MAG: DUF4433 domain-containing protein [Cyclobacteriaceae bacterium]